MDQIYSLSLQTLSTLLYLSPASLYRVTSDEILTHNERQDKDKDTHTHTHFQIMGEPTQLEPVKLITLEGEFDIQLLQSDEMIPPAIE